MHHPTNTNVTKNRFIIISSIAFLALVIGTVFYHFIESLSWLDALYLSVITLTTVGYGDLSPQTDLGKIFTMVYIIIGVSIIFGFMNTFYEKRIEEFGKRNKKKNIKKK